MLTHLRSAFKLPEFDTPQQARQAALLYNILWLAITAASLRLFLIAIDPNETLFVAVGERFGGVTLLAACVYALRRGYLQTANVLLLVGTLLSTALVALNLGNLAGDPCAILISLIVVSGLTAGPRGVLWTGAGALLVTAVVTFLFVYEIVPSSDLVMTPSSTSGLSMAIIFVTLTYLLYLAARTLDRLLGKLTHVNASLMQEMGQRTRASEALQQSQAELSMTLDNAPIGIFTFDMNGYLLRVNNALCTMLGYSAETLLEQHMQDLISEKDRFRFAESMQQLVDGDVKHVRLEQEFCTHDGLTCNVILHLGLTRDSMGVPQHVIASVEDVTERRKIQEKINMAQKQESIGVLAGGIAHDFNNLLMAMLGQGTLAVEKLARNRPAINNIEKVIAAAEKAALLTNQLLAYAGKGQVEMNQMSLNHLIEENRQLLAVALSKNVELETDLECDLPLIHGDLAQLQQVVMNLLINASDASAETGGTIRICTRQLQLTESSCPRWQISPTDTLPVGDYVLLEVSDEGKGMDRRTLRRIFDPFFTTKETGHGLGLAAVMGIVRAHGGGMTVDSIVNEGTIFRMVFPIPPDLYPQDLMDNNMLTTMNPTGTVLIIDDEIAVCEVVADMLDLIGYESMVAQSGIDGLAMYQAHASEIDLVLLDLTMPGLSGEETFAKLRQIDPDVRVIISSGHSRHQTSATFSGAEGIDFLPKPYNFVMLESTIHQNIALSMVVS